MKILILMLVSLAVVACGVPQEEHDEVSNRLSQTETKLDAVSTELKTVSSELEANNKLVDGLKERIAFIPQKPPTFATGEASALVHKKVQDDIMMTGSTLNNLAYASRFNSDSTTRMCMPIIFLMDYDWAKNSYTRLSTDSGDWLTNYAKNNKNISLDAHPTLIEEYSDEGHWLVTLNWGEPLDSDNPFDGDPYQWKVYELSGAVERIGVDRTYC